MRGRTRSVARAAVALIVALVIHGAASAVPAAAAAIPRVSGLRPLTIVTMPAIAGVSVVLNGKALTTAKDGKIRTVATKEQRDALAANRDAHLTMYTRQVALPGGVRARFHGWYDGGYHFSGTDFSGQVEVAAFDVDYLTSFAFVDSHGAAIDKRRVTGMEVRDTLGTTIDAHGSVPVWLLGRSVVAAAGRVALKDTEYRFTKVTVGGANVVTRGRQRFAPSHGSRVRVALHLFTVVFRARDAIFGRPAGSAIDIEMEDGTTRHLVLQHGSVTVAGLPSGQYHVKTDARGLGGDQTFAISGDQTADIDVIDPLDLAVAAAVLALIAGGLVFAGRRMRGTRRPAAGGGEQGIETAAPSTPVPAMSDRDPR